MTTVSIPLTQGKVALIDEEDYERVAIHRWHVSHRYAAFRHNYRQTLLHRFILNAPDGVSVDHINGDGLDNRRSNLRLASPAENMANRKINENNTSGSKGVYWREDRNRWIAQVVQGRRKYSRQFTTFEDAVNEYNRMALELFGPFARLN